MHPPRAREVETLGEGDSTSGRMTGFRRNTPLAAERPAWYTHSMDDVRGALAANLAELRKEENLTQAEFAAQFNYSDKAVSKWERGDSLPDVVMLKTIADLYGLRVDDLLTDGGVAAAYAAATESGGEKQHDAYLMSKVLIAAMWVTMVCRGRRVFVFAVQHRQDVLDGVRVGGAGVVRRGVPLLPPLGGGDDAAVRVFVPVRVEHDHGVLFSVPAV